MSYVFAIRMRYKSAENAVQDYLSGIFTSYVFAILMRHKSAENAVQDYLSGIYAHKGGSIANLSDNGTEFKNTTPNRVCDQLGIKDYFQTHFHPKATQELKMCTISSKECLLKF